jgi:hypothetical protein
VVDHTPLKREEPVMLISSIKPRLSSGEEQQVISEGHLGWRSRVLSSDGLSARQTLAPIIA